MQAMIEDLADFSIEEINAAFKKWRHTNTKIPTPASILKLLRDCQRVETNGLKKYSAWDGDWQSYLQYLDDNNALSSNFIQVGGYYRLRPGYNPPWEMKDFK
jgi:hypothetical protein